MNGVDVIGQTISHYKILEKLGEGGMGVVYQAEDTRLKRTVALKFLPQQVNAGDTDRARFLLEAQAAAALSHPNICTIYGIDEHEGQMFIAMEFIDGQTLRAKKGSVNATKAIDIGIQVAEGLAAAHEKGIVHRDIKPENIMVRKDGIVQIMDFGLAKLRASGASRLTKQGSTVGTAGYMSPEQVQGQETDHRSDIFSLGVVLYELFSGELPFKGVHETALMYEIVNVDPAPMSATAPDVDPELDRIVLECLQKDPDERYQGAKDISKDLKRFKRESSRQKMSRVTAVRPIPRENSEGRVSEKTVRPARPFLWPALTLVFGLLALLALWNPWRRTDRPDTLVMRFPIGLPLSAPLLGAASTVAISPDGRNFVYLSAEEGNEKLYLRPINQFTAQPMAGTNGASDPFFSPDGQWIAFFANGKLKKVSIFGGSPQDICVLPGFMRGGWWGQDDHILLGQINRGIFSVPANGGTPVEVTRVDSTQGENSHRFPQPLPDGKTVIFTVKYNNITTFDDAVIAAENIVSHERKILVRGGSYGRFIPSGHILFARGSSIYAVPFDPVAVETKGPPLPVEDGGMLNPLSGDANFAVSNAGTLIYSPLGSYSGVDASLMWIDRHGTMTPLLDTSRAYGEGSLSPDGQRLAMSIRAANDDIWVYQINRGTMTRLTFGGGNSGAPIWTPDGKRVIYASERRKKLQLFSKLWDGSGSEERLNEGMDVTILHWPSVSPDGKTLAYGQDGDIFTMRMDSGMVPQRLMQTNAYEMDPSFSPDGHWLLYISNESGQNEVCVVPFPRGEGKYQISTNGAQLARWQADGKKMFYLSGRQVMEVDVRLSPSFDFSPPRKVIDLPAQWTSFWDVTSDGSRFLIGMSKPLDVRASQVDIVVGWFEELRKKFSTGTR